ncbi:MAG: hypothetical protein ACI9JM_001273 [Halioglobus sp.]|jgi:hypothetical protein
MLKITGLSLLLGAMAVVAGLNQFLLPSATSLQPPPTISFSADSVLVTSGKGAVHGSQLQLELTKTGMAGLNLLIAPFNSEDYSFIHLWVEQSDVDLKAVIVWTTEETGTEKFNYSLESKSRDSLWLATAELAGWQGNITTLSLVFIGNEGDTAAVRDFSVFPSSLEYQLKSIYSDWAGFVPWSRAAMNTYTGVTRVSTFYPVPVIATWFVFSVIAYGLLLLLRKKLQFEFRVIALIFLACWIALDLPWQKRLLDQVADSQRQFSDKSTHEKLTIGPDAKLYNFATEVKRHLESPSSRIFVSTSDAYIGLRTAYYLYPYNTLYSFHGMELPYTSLLRSGDYVALLKPSETRFLPRRKRLETDRKEHLSVETIYSDGSGTLLRIN